jgi:two-component system sensor histidine kinase KdpD
MVADEARRLERLVRNLLDLTRLEAGCVIPKEPHAIDEVIGAALCRLEGQLIGYEVRTSVPPDIPFAALDPMLIEQVLINLVENVLHHAGPTPLIELFARAHDEGILVEVADRGRGLTPGDEERVFERLVRGQRTPQGSGAGLGLTICRAIVGGHGGRIWMENRPGGGAIVRFTLPAYASSATLEAQAVGQLARIES